MPDDEVTLDDVDVMSAQAGLEADLEAVADLDAEQLRYLEHADEIREDDDQHECDLEDVYPGDEQYRDMSSEELLHLEETNDG